MPISEQRCLELAIAEMRDPKLRITEQFLSVHRVKGDESGPLPVGGVESPTHFDVYFQPVDESYFLVLTVADNEAGGAVRSCRAEAKSRVYLGVTSDTLTPEEVTMRLGLPPTKSWRRGDRYGPDGALTRSFNGWYFDPIGDGPGECDQKLRLLLDRLEAPSTQIRALVAQCHAEIVIAYEGYQCQMWGFHWDAEILRRLCALGADQTLICTRPARTFPS